VDLKNVIVGKWKRKGNEDVITFNGNHTANVSSSVGAVMSGGSWSIGNNKLIVMWEKYGEEILVFNGKANQISSETYGWVGSK